MNIFIDAYNLLKQLHGATQVSETQKNIFIDKLKHFIRSKGHHIYLVYDGGQSMHPEIEHSGAVTLIYSGYKLSADEVIKQKIIEYAREHTLLVSDDRQLCDYVAFSGFACLGTADFYKFMQANIKKEQAAYIKKGVAHKNPDYSSTPELDTLMQEAACQDYYKDDGVLPEKSFSPHLSKKEKKLKKLVKKL